MKIYIEKNSFEFGQLSIWDVTYIVPGCFLVTI
jgi:hypothetical protein